MSCRQIVSLLAFFVLAEPGRATSAEPAHAFDLTERLMGFELPADDELVLRFRNERRRVDLDGTQLDSFEMDDAFRGVAVSGDRRLLIHDTHPVDTKLVVWNLGTREVVGRAPEGAGFTKPVRFLKEDGSEAISRVGVDFVRFALPSFEKLETYDGPREKDLWPQGFGKTADGRLVSVFLRHPNYLDEPGGVLVWDVLGKRERLSFDLPESPRGAGLDPSGRHLLVMTRRKVGDEPVTRVHLFDATDETKSWDLGTYGQTPWSSFSPDGRRLALLDDQGRVTVYDVKSRRQFFTTTLGPATERRMVSGLRFPTDGRRLLVAYNVADRPDWKGRVRVYDLPRE